MDVGVYILGGIILLFSIVFGMLDVNLNSSMKQNLFESVRAANQNALLEMEEAYESREILTTTRMIETWLSEFASSEDLRYEEIKLNFIQMETDPPLYLVYAEGFNDRYVMISADAYASYFSGATIITKD